MQATKDLENYDAERHEEFKRYEMLKEHERREYLKGLDQEKREKEEKRLQELKEKHRLHPKVNAPVQTQDTQLCFKAQKAQVDVPKVDNQCYKDSTVDQKKWF